MDKRSTIPVDLFVIPRYPSSPARPVIPGLTGNLVIPDLFGNPSASVAATPGACCFAALYG
ncbi:MAG: hypothetical protein II434_01605 [Bacteroidales bacterium]|nr:hypothetical protein [Bacteroidales bacterium]